MTTISRAISRAVSYKVITASTEITGQENGQIILSYNPDDPCAVVLDFPHYNVQWRCARDLIADGLTRLAGVGDVACWTRGIWYHIALSSPDGQVVFKVLVALVVAFLSDTAKVVPYGAEQVDVDAMLAGLLGGAR